jgi:dTDP-4-amino-4,6-dideoxygalactose transaminase
MDLIPLFDLKLTEADIEEVVATLRSGWLTMGPRTREFEEAFAASSGAAYAVAVSSCTAALHLAYLAVGVGPGDEVVVPSYTFVATAAAVRHCGATPVFADIRSLEDPTIDPEDVFERCLSPRTKAIVGVHFAGYPAAVDRLAELCAQREIALVEDAAHGPGGTLRGRALGTWGRAAAFSLFSNKVLAVGEGGLVVSDDEALAGRVASLRSHAMSSGTWERHSGHTNSYDVLETGFNYRIDEPRSALAHSRLRQLAGDIDARRRLALAYRERLSAHEGLIVPFTADSVMDSSCYIMPVFLREAEQRDEVRQRLLEHHGVQTSVHYPPVHGFSAYRSLHPDPNLPLTESASSAEITIPLFPHMSDTQLDRVVSALEAEVPGFSAVG